MPKGICSHPNKRMETDLFICNILFSMSSFIYLNFKQTELNKNSVLPLSETFVESWSHYGVHDLPVFLSDGPVLLEIYISTQLEYSQVYLSSSFHLLLFQPAIAWLDLLIELTVSTYFTYKLKFNTKVCKFFLKDLCFLSILF